MPLARKDILVYSWRVEYYIGRSTYISLYIVTRIVVTNSWDVGIRAEFKLVAILFALFYGAADNYELLSGLYAFNLYNKIGAEYGYSMTSYVSGTVHDHATWEIRSLEMKIHR